LKIAEIQKLTKEQEAAKTAAQQLKDVYTDIGMSIKSGIVDAIQGAVDGTKTLGEVASGVLKNIANKVLDVAINMALFGAMSGTGTGGGLLSGLFKPKPRANGGPVTGGSTYLVGERGPELFVPGRSGTIVPNDKMGSGGTTNVVVNVDATGSKVQGDGTQAGQLAKVISAAVQQEIIKQKRPGGVLA
jgi:phage-related minor tail protein